MCENSYRSLLSRACKSLDIVLNHVLHLGRAAGPAQCELEEVNGNDSRALGNWKQDVFAACYSTQLPLPAMRVMAGHDKRQGFHSNPRTTYFGNESHQQLPHLIFPWLDEALQSTDKSRNKTAAGFLSLMESLRWVILQDAAVMLHEGRDHYMFSNNPDIFNSIVFKDFQSKLIQHIEDKKRDDRFNATLDSVLPGVHNRLDHQIFAVEASHAKMNMMQRSITSVIKNYEDFKETYMNEKVASKAEKLASEQQVDRSMSNGFQNVAKSMGSVFRNEMHALVKHIGAFPMQQEPIGLLENGIQDDCELKQPAVASIEGTGNVLTVTEEGRASSTHSTVLVQAYNMPKHFPTVSSMIVHWYKVVKEKENTRNKTWRSHLSASEKKRFQRFSRVIRAYRKVLNTGVTVTEAENMFETYYGEHKQSLASLSDVFAKQILD